jgi:DNA-binding MarR family transcriptional regulator
MMKQKRKSEDSVRHGTGLATIRFHSVHGDIGAVSEMMNSLNSPGAQAAFADTWLRNAAYTLTTCWEIVYHLCQLIKEEEIYLHPEWLRGESFSSFEEYFQARIASSLNAWIEFEEVYNLLKNCQPEALEKLALLSDVTNGKLSQTNGDRIEEPAKGIEDASNNGQKTYKVVKSYYDDVLRVYGEFKEELGQIPTNKAIAERLGIHVSTVAKHLKKAGLSKSKKPRKRYYYDILKVYQKLGKKLGRKPTNKAIAELLGIHSSTVSRNLKKAKLQGELPKVFCY